ncbi:tail fiber domain-containing protein [Leptolyngbya sp. AN03gr2]|uniref:tail fiber domain-containing protein n=1 Tax=unclassified Leptolyngbya TaxID=2650499 RepID=UPI003D318E10
MPDPKSKSNPAIDKNDQSMGDIVNYEQPPYVSKRVRYFDGQYLKVQDFVEDQQYHIDRARRPARSLFVAGILDGLTMQKGSLKYRVQLYPGSAIDPTGQQILLDQKLTYNKQQMLRQQQDYFELDVESLSTKQPNEKTELIVFVSFAEQEADSEEGGHTRFEECPQIEIVPLDRPPSNSIPLAKLTITKDGVSVDPTVRQYSGLQLPVPTGKPLTLRSAGDGNSDRAIFSGNLTLNGNLGIGTLSPETRLHVMGQGGTNVDLLVNGRLKSANNDGGLHIANDRFIGGHSINKLGLWNGNAWQLTVQQNGTVGIGTQSPTERLEVSGGNLKVNGSVMANNATVSENVAANSATLKGLTMTGGGIIVTSGKEETILRNAAGATVSAETAKGITFTPNPGIGTGDVAWLRYYVPSKTGEQTVLELGTANDATDHIALMPSGSVGIGTTSPTERLEVSGGNLKVNGSVMANSATLEAGLTMTGGGIVVTSGKEDPILGKDSAGREIVPAGTAKGITFTPNPKGGTGDVAWLRYYARPGTKEGTVLELGVGNDIADGVNQLVDDITDHIALMPSGNVGIGTINPEWKTHIVGDLYVDGNIISKKRFWLANSGAGKDDKGNDKWWRQEGGYTPDTALAKPSDLNLKKNIQPIGDALAQLCKLKPVTFAWTDPDYFLKELDQKFEQYPLRDEQHDADFLHYRSQLKHSLSASQSGFIAQDLEQVFPDWVSKGDDGYKRVNLSQLNAVLVQGILELKQMFEDLKLENQSLKQQIEQLKKD